MVLKICIPNGYRYIETKDFQVIDYKNGEITEDLDVAAMHIESNSDETKRDYSTFIFTDDDRIYKIEGDLIGYVLNDKGQTIERL